MLPVLARMVRLPAAMEAVPRLRALLLVRATSLAPVLARATAPLKTLLLVRLIAPLAALKEAAPLTVSALPAAWPMLPEALMLSAPLLTETLPRVRAWLLVKAALPAALVER